MTDFGMRVLSVHKSSRVWALMAMMFASLATNHAIADTKSEKVSAHVLQAEIALQRQEYKTAASEYRKAAELSRNVDVARQATRIAFNYGFNKDALGSARRWVKLDEGSDEALLYVAQLQLRLGDIRASRRSLNRLLKRSEQAPDERLVALIPFLSQEDPEDASELMRQLAKPYKNSASAQYAAGVMALQARDTDEATNRASRALELKPDWLKAQLLKARAMLLAGDQEGAIDYTSSYPFSKRPFASIPTMPRPTRRWRRFTGTCCRTTGLSTWTCPPRAPRSGFMNIWKQPSRTLRRSPMRCRPSSWPPGASTKTR